LPEISLFPTVAAWCMGATKHSSEPAPRFARQPGFMFCWQDWRNERRRGGESATSGKAGGLILWTAQSGLFNSLSDHLWVGNPMSVRFRPPAPTHNPIPSSIVLKALRNQGFSFLLSVSSVSNGIIMHFAPHGRLKRLKAGRAAGGIKNQQTVFLRTITWVSLFPIALRSATLFTK
jgi:hypothetical protein